VAENYMKKTPFPTRPLDVVALTIQEFTRPLDLTDSPSLNDVCGRFPDDANRALVWLVRFRALQALTDAGVGAWLASGAGSTRDAYDVASRLELNELWEFDRAAFCLAVKAVAAKRA
jgi:hypothetical protein